MWSKNTNCRKFETKTLPVCRSAIACACPGINPRVKSGRFMKLLPDYEHMDYRDVYTHRMYFSLVVEHEGLCLADLTRYSGGRAPSATLRVDKLSAACFVFKLTKWEQLNNLCFWFLLADRNSLTHVLTPPLRRPCIPELA